MFSKDTFCVLPWSSILIKPSGGFTVCCFSGATDNNLARGTDDGPSRDQHGVQMNVKTHSILDALNSETHKAIRLAQSKNERHENCKVCWDRDDSHALTNQQTTSLRNFRSFIQFPKLDNAITIEKAPLDMQPDGSIKDLPISLDLRFTNVCNMKCIMCSSKFSNQWYEDEIAIYGKTIEPNIKFANVNGKIKGQMESWHDSPEWWSQFELLKHRIRQLYLTGGEPFIVKGHDLLIDKLIEADLAKNIIIEYDTNLTVINDKILERLSHFKEVEFAISCDDVEDKFELIRFGGKFNVLLENLEKIKNRNIKIRHISSCVGIYSFYSPIRVYEYFSKMGYDMYSFRFLRLPDHTDLAFLPDQLKLKLIKIYNESSLPEKWKNFHCGYLENNMGKPIEECERQVRRHIDYLNKLDELRGTDWKTTLPEVAELLHDYL